MDVEQIAKGLTKAQREAVSKGHGFSRKTMHNLQDAKLIAGWSFDGSANVGWILEWTPLGIAVRAYLLASQGRA